MDDADLIAYVDGEADAPTVARFEQLLRDDPAVRQQVLALVRQRVVMTRVFAQASPALLPAAPPAAASRWWVRPLVAAAAGVLIAIAAFTFDWSPVTRGGTNTQPVASALVPGTEIGIEGTAVVLADGSRLSPAPGTLLRVPESGQPWRLLRGSVRCDIPLGATPPAFSTDEVEVTTAGSGLVLARTDHGTEVAAGSGAVAIRDHLTNANKALTPGQRWWIPSDLGAPREATGEHGTVRGVVVSVRGRGSLVVLRTRFGETRVMPEWIGGVGGGLDQAMSARLAKLVPGDRVAVAWAWSEHLRVRDFTRIADVGSAAAPAP